MSWDRQFRKIAAWIVIPAFLVMFISMACERATTVSFEDRNPPKFVLTGSGTLGLLRVGGPDKQRDTL
jgi:hypothetical protein